MRSLGAVVALRTRASRRTSWIRTASTHGESGAVLVLALVFMVVTALIVTGLTAWMGNDIKNIGNLKTARSAVYAAGGAVQTATWNVRYSYQATSSGFCPNPTGDANTSTDPFTAGGTLTAHDQIYVWCDITTNEGSSDSRVVTLSAYPSGQCSPPGSPTSCSGRPDVESKVTFDDFSSTNVNNCGSATSTTCGSGQTIDSWVVQPGLN